MKLTPLHNQVGGHDGVLSMGDDNEIIVKPSLPQEHQFYEEAVLHPELQAWMPEYYGSLTLTRQQPQQQSEDGKTAPTIKAMNGFVLDDVLSSDDRQVTTEAPTSASDLIQHAVQEIQGAASEAGDTTVEGSADASDAECLCLENISRGFKKACVLDLKLGTQLYDDNASEEKKARLGAVAANTTSGKLGIRLTGFQVYDDSKGDFTKYSKHYGKGLTEDTILDGFRAFFSANIGSKRMRLVIERFVNDLADFLVTIKTQELRMRSSSLLMMYEGHAEAFDLGLQLEQEKIEAAVARAKAHLERESRERKEGEDEYDSDDSDDSEDDSDEEVAQKVTDMRLIDFAHSTWTPGLGPDESVIQGVESTLALFEKLLQQDYPSDD
ncbi:hypothetical protein BGX28_009190 [Mortierella sp. GBA30]|nr:hypothetical protein BGX28_009190 [Mortierella sp. GBA30]